MQFVRLAPPGAVSASIPAARILGSPRAGSLNYLKKFHLSAPRVFSARRRYLRSSVAGRFRGALEIAEGGARGHLFLPVFPAHFFSGLAGDIFSRLGK